MSTTVVALGQKTSLLHDRAKISIAIVHWRFQSSPNSKLEPFLSFFLSRQVLTVYDHMSCEIYEFLDIQLFWLTVFLVPFKELAGSYHQF